MLDYITINMFERMWSDIPGKILLIILLVSLLSLFAMVIWGVFSVVDGAFLTYQRGQAKVINKTFVPAHNTIVMQTTTVGNVTTMTPMNIHHPDSYFITLTTQGMKGIFYLSQKNYEKIKQGMTLNVKYSKKRMTNSLKFKEIDFWQNKISDVFYFFDKYMMKIEANKQYHFNFKYEFPNFLGKLADPIMSIDGYLFEFDNNIYVVSFIKNEKCFKHVFNKEGSLIIFENYQGEFITCSAQTINSITQIYNEVILQNSYNIEKLNNNFIEIFNLITPPYQIDRYDLKYSFNYKLEERNKEDYLSKYVEFYSDYAKQFNNEIENNELILIYLKIKTNIGIVFLIILEELYLNSFLI